MDTNTYKYQQVSDKHAAIIHLNDKVMGGNEALEFFSLTEELMSDSKCIIVDMSSVSAINSSGLGMLVKTMTNLKKHNVEFCLCACSDKVINLLKMTHLDKVIKVCPDTDSALSDCE